MTPGGCAAAARTSRSARPFWAPRYCPVLAPFSMVQCSPPLASSLLSIQVILFHGMCWGRVLEGCVGSFGWLVPGACPNTPAIPTVASTGCHRLPGMDGAEEGRLAMGNSCTYQRLQCFMLLRVGRVLCEGMSRPLVVRVRTLACSPSAASYLSLTCLPSH